MEPLCHPRPEVLPAHVALSTAKEMRKHLNFGGFIGITSRQVVVFWLAESSRSNENSVVFKCYNFMPLPQIFLKVSSFCNFFSAQMAAHAGNARPIRCQRCSPLPHFMAKPSGRDIQKVAFHRENLRGFAGGFPANHLWEWNFSNHWQTTEKWQ